MAEPFIPRRVGERRHQTTAGPGGANLHGFSYHRVHNSHWTVIDCGTDGCFRLTGHPARHLIGDARIEYGRLVHPDDRGKAWDAIRGAVDQKSAFEVDYRIVTATGSYRWVLDRGRPLATATGTEPLIEGTVTDVTGLVRTMRRRQRDLEMEAISRLAGKIGRDFDDALAAIHGRCDLLLDALAANGPESEHLRAIQQAGRRASALVRGLLEFSQRGDVPGRAHDANHLVESMVPHVQLEIGSEVELQTRVQPALGSVRVDPERLTRAVLEIVRNAADAMPDGGALILEADVAIPGPANGAPAGASPATGIRLRFRDDGRGMTPETCTRAFEPFFKSDPDAAGIGLGLSVAYGIVRRFGGEIGLQSVPGSGSTVTILLPRVASEADPPDPRSLLE